VGGLFLYSHRSSLFKLKSLLCPLTSLCLDSHLSGINVTIPTSLFQMYSGLHLYQFSIAVWQVTIAQSSTDLPFHIISQFPWVRSMARLSAGSHKWAARSGKDPLQAQVLGGLLPRAAGLRLLLSKSNPFTSLCHFPFLSVREDC
jgi:hypothetical protein